MTIYATDRSNNNAIIEGFKVYGFLPKSGYHFHHPTPMGSIARYQCDAGNRWNRRIDNFDLTTHDVTCQVYLFRLHKRTSKIFNFSGRRYMDRELADLCRHHLMPGPNHPQLPGRDRDHLDLWRLHRLPDQDHLEVQRPAILDPKNWGRHNSRGDY